MKITLGELIEQLSEIPLPMNTPVVIGHDTDIVGFLGEVAWDDPDDPDREPEDREPQVWLFPENG